MGTFCLLLAAFGRETRLTGITGQPSFFCSPANQLTQVDLYHGGSYDTLSTAAYNGAGERFSLTTWALGVPQTVTYLLAAGQLLASDDGSNQTTYLYGRNLLAEYGHSWTYPLRDAAPKGGAVSAKW